NAAALWSLAQAPGTPRGAKILTTALTNQTELEWKRGTEAGLTGYEVVWRETTDTDWTHVIDVGDATRHTVDLSKDNVFFGVRAVGRSGLRSPVAFPAPQR
ncbi:aminopeptidase, partial [Streptomyces sp. NPDC003379]